MLFVMMVGTPQHQVVEIGGAAVLVGLQVVDLTPGSRDVAPGPAAPTIAGDERPILRLGGVAHLATEVEDQRTGV